MLEANARAKYLLIFYAITEVDQITLLDALPQIFIFFPSLQIFLAQFVIWVSEAW